LIQNRFATQPEIYKQFLEILQTYQRESKPIQDVYAQVTQLFSTAPDLLEDFKQFLPESAAQAKAQQMAARQAAEEAAVTSSVRGEPYPSGGQINQAQTPRNDAKVPPIGNFAPPSAAKDGKKHRRTGLGAQTTASSSTQLATPQADAVAQGSRVTGPQVGGVYKVSLCPLHDFFCLHDWPACTKCSPTPQQHQSSAFHQSSHQHIHFSISQWSIQRASSPSSPQRSKIPFLIFKFLPLPTSHLNLYLHPPAPL
jgi:histone deacetylase complex regulatory component SIN3